MRAAIVTACAVLSLPLCWGGAAVAQTASAGAAAVKPSARVGSLSPDEQRRAIRGRERAAAAEKAARDKVAVAGGAQDAPLPKQAAGAVSGAGQVNAKAQEAKVQVGKAQQVEARGSEAPGIVTHRSVAADAQATGDKPAAETPSVGVAPRVETRPKRLARAHRTHRSRLASAERAPQIGDRVPDGSSLRPMPPGMLRVYGPRPYERLAGDMPAQAPWGYRPVYPSYPYYRQGW